MENQREAKSNELVKMEYRNFLRGTREMGWYLEGHVGRLAQVLGKILPILINIINTHACMIAINH